MVTPPPSGPSWNGTRTRVYNLCLRILGDRDDARDAAQETFVAALRKLAQFRGDAAFTTWLHRVTVNTCYDELRRRKRRPMLHVTAPDDPDRPHEPGPPVADHADEVAGTLDVAAALAAVPEEFRVALVLADVQDLPYEEIGRILDVPVGHGEVPGAPGPYRARPRARGGLGGTIRIVADVGGGVMTHPEELLAGYVDGTSSSQDRAVVDAHLQHLRTMPARGRRGARGRGGTRSPPGGALPFGPGREGDGGAGDGRRCPRDHVRASLAALGGRPPPRRRRSSWSRRSCCPRSEAASSSADGASASAPVTATVSGTATLELSSENFQPDTLGALASDAAAKLTAGAAGVQPESLGLGPAPARTAAPGAAAKATACIRQAFEQVPGTPVRLIEAKFQGRPAYIGFYAESPGVGQPLDALTVRVASVQGCEILHIAQVST